MDYYIKKNVNDKNTAGSKAPDDINQISEEMGLTALVYPTYPEKLSGILLKLKLLLDGLLFWSQVLYKVKENESILYQHPHYVARVVGVFLPLLKMKGIRLVAVIHDLDSLRGMVLGNKSGQVSSKSQYEDVYLLRKFDRVIVHNDSMKNYLLSRGYKEEKIIVLEIFDYLTRYDVLKLPIEKQIIIAGNLAPTKSGYLYTLPDLQVGYHLYGPNFEGDESNSIRYHGSLDPETLISEMVPGFGLVWDGESIHTCQGPTGEYLRYNNPHKTSLYLAAERPVVIWEEAALAEFITKENLGFVVKDLSEIAGRFEKLTGDELQEMRMNVQKVGRRIREGYYFRTALIKAFNRGNS